MPKLLNDKNELNTYRGNDGIFYNIKNKSISFSDKVSPQLLTGLDQELAKKKKGAQIVLGMEYDPYPQIEENERVTREALELINENRCGVTIITKSKLVLRDLDIIKKINEHSTVEVVLMFPTSSGSDLAIIDGTTIEDKAFILNTLKENDIKMSLWVNPILPYINDDINNAEMLINLCIKYNIKYFMYNGSNIIVDEKNKDALYKILDANYRGLKSKYEDQRLNDLFIRSPKEQMVQKYIEELCENNKIVCDKQKVLSHIYSYQRKYTQLSLF